MSYQSDTVGKPFIAASLINEGAVVGPVASIAEQVVAAGSAAFGFPYGLALATAASPGDPVSIQTEGIGKGVVAPGGSIVAGDLVSAATLGQLQKFVPSMASGGVPRYFVGVARQNALAGQRFAVHIQPGVSL